MNIQQVLNNVSKEDKELLKQIVGLKEHYAHSQAVVSKLDEMMQHYIAKLEEEAKRDSLDDLILKL